MADPLTWLVDQLNGNNNGGNNNSPPGLPMAVVVAGSLDAKVLPSSSMTVNVMGSQQDGSLRAVVDADANVVIRNMPGDVVRAHVTAGGPNGGAIDVHATVDGGTPFQVGTIDLAPIQLGPIELRPIQIAPLQIAATNFGLQPGFTVTFHLFGWSWLTLLSVKIRGAATFGP